MASDPAKAIMKAYNAWLETPLGKKYQEERKEWIPVEVTDLPKGWALYDGSVEDGYFLYYNYETEFEVCVDEGWSLPVWGGGYPHGHFLMVKVRDARNEDVSREIASFMVEKLGWKEAYSQANLRAIEEMKKLG